PRVGERRAHSVRFGRLTTEAGLASEAAAENATIGAARTAQVAHGDFSGLDALVRARSRGGQVRAARLLGEARPRADAADAIEPALAARLAMRQEVGLAADAGRLADAAAARTGERRRQEEHEAPGSRGAAKDRLARCFMPLHADPHSGLSRVRAHTDRRSSRLRKTPRAAPLAHCALRRGRAARR